MAWRSPTSGWVTRYSVTSSGDRPWIPRAPLEAAGVREERKLKLKLVVKARFQWRFDSSLRHGPE